MPAGTLCEIFGAFLRLGLTSFGGPIAHLGYFRRDVVVRRGWLSEEAYAELVGLGQFLPGPASSQVGFAIGLLRGGWLGGVAAWTAFSLPSAVAMFLFAGFAGQATGPLATQAIHGLKLVAIPIVAQALFDMGRRLLPDFRRRALAVGAAIVMVATAMPSMQILAILSGGLIGAWFCTDQGPVWGTSPGWRPGRVSGAMCLLLFALLLGGLPIVASLSGMKIVALADIFYRAGSLVFGGGHVVLPLLRAELVPGWMGDAPFLAGYGAAQAVPGPLFTLGAYLGAIALPTSPLIAGLVALIALSLPGLLLMAGALPFHALLRGNARARGAVAGINAVVVGILAAALYDPLCTTGLGDVGDGVVAIIGVALLVLWRWPPLAILLLTLGWSMVKGVAG